MEKYRFINIEKIAINGKQQFVSLCYIYNPEEKNYYFLKTAIIPTWVKRHNWEAFIDNEEYYLHQGPKCLERD